jgi:hypothetical protein
MVDFRGYPKDLGVRRDYSRVKEELSKSSLHCLTASTMILNGLWLTDLLNTSRL